MASKNTARFVVDLSGIGLADDQVKKIEHSIHAAVLENLSGLKVKDDLRLRFPREWLGLIATTDRLPLGDLDKQLQDRMQF